MLSCLSLQVCRQLIEHKADVNSPKVKWIIHWLSVVFEIYVTNLGRVCSTPRPKERTRESDLVSEPLVLCFLLLLI